MVKIKGHIKIGEIYKIPQLWYLQYQIDVETLQDVAVNKDEIITLLEFEDLGYNTCSVTFLYDNKICKRKSVAKDALNRLELLE